MKAILCTKYGSPDVLEIHEVSKPIAKDDEVLIRIHAASVSSGDARLRKFNFPPLFWLPMRLILGLVRPRKNILGSQFAGKIEAVGKAVTKFKVEDKVFGAKGMKQGCYAQYTCAQENSVLTKMPKNISYEEAACIPFGGMTALHLLRPANIKKGQKVLIYGASGAVGTAAVQLAKHLGAEITAVCSKANSDFVKGLGATYTIDYREQDFTKNGEKYDVIFDTVIKINEAHCKDSLTQNGRFISAKTLISESVEKLEYLKQLVEKGEYSAVIDKTYDLENIVKAHEYVDTGHKKGNIAISI